MDIKTFFKETKTGYVVLNLVLAMVVVGLLLTLLLSRLSRYTEHGEEVVVPSLTQLYIEEALPLLTEQGLRMVVIDSTYSRKVPLGTIVEQNPPANSHAKHGRSVYVIVNAKQRRMVPVPDLTDMSYRQARASLRQLDIIADSVEYEPSEYKDLVLDIRYKGQSVVAGDRIEEGSRVILVVGRGQGDEMVTVPDLRGRSLLVARSLLLGQYLTVGDVVYDEEPTEETKEMYVVYSQTPAAGEQWLEGTRVTLKLSTDLEKTVTADNQSSEEEFF